MIASAAPSPRATEAAAEAWPSRPYAWYVVVMLMISYAFSIIDRTGMGLLVQPIEADLHITDSQMGLLQGVAFAIFYSVLGLPIGYLTDRVNRRSLIALGIWVWSAATICCGLATGFGGLFAARIGVGAGEATLSPAGASMIADYFPPESRSKAFGIFAIGTTIGVAMAFLMGGAAIQFAGHLRDVGPAWLTALPPWKIVFIMIGAPGLLLGLIFALTVREPVRRDRAELAPTLSIKPTLRFLRSQWGVYAGLVGWSVLNSVSIYALVGWFPQVLIRVHGWTAASAGEVLGTYGMIGGLISCVVGGWSVSWLHKWGRADAPVIVAIAASIWVTIAGVAGSLAPSGNAAVLGYCVMGLAINNGGIAVLTAINRITPNEMRGQVLSLFSMATGLISLSVGPLAVGYLSDHVYGPTLGMGKSLATVLAVAGSLGILTLLKTRRSFINVVQRWSEGRPG
jgi:MFS family permease